MDLWHSFSSTQWHRRVTVSLPYVPNFFNNSIASGLFLISFLNRFSYWVHVSFPSYQSLCSSLLGASSLHHSSIPQVSFFLNRIPYRDIKILIPSCSSLVSFNDLSLILVGVVVVMSYNIALSLALSSESLGLVRSLFPQHGHQIPS